jgi:hypothetical protein
MSTPVSLAAAIALVVLATLTTAAPPAAADVAARTCRGPDAGPVRVIADDEGACIGFVRRAADGGELRVDLGRRASGVLLASPSGRTVVMVDSYLYASVDRHGRVATVEARPVENPTVVAIYRDGALVAAHGIHDLLGRRPRIERSVSHIRWTGELPGAIGDRRFTLPLLAGERLVFDAATGRVLAPARRR